MEWLINVVIKLQTTIDDLRDINAAATVKPGVTTKGVNVVKLKNSAIGKMSWKHFLQK